LKPPTTMVKNLHHTPTRNKEKEMTIKHIIHHGLTPGYNYVTIPPLCQHHDNGFLSSLQLWVGKKKKKIKGMEGEYH